MDGALPLFPATPRPGTIHRGRRVTAEAPTGGVPVLRDPAPDLGPENGAQRRTTTPATSRPGDTVCVNAGDDKNHQKRSTVLLGPRLGHFCATCIRKRNKDKKQTAKEKRTERIYELTPKEVRAIRDEMPKNVRGVPVCPGCLFATGQSRALATDHDHEKENAGVPMRDCVRGFLCSTCNQMIEKYGVAGFRRLIDYILDPPAPRALAKLDRKAE